MSIETTTTALAELDEALAHAGATLNLMRALPSQERAAGRVRRYLDALLDERLVAAAAEKFGATISWPDTCQGLSPRQVGEVLGRSIEGTAEPEVNSRVHPSDAVA